MYYANASADYFNRTYITKNISPIGDYVKAIKYIVKVTFIIPVVSTLYTDHSLTVIVSAQKKSFVVSPKFEIYSYNIFIVKLTVS